MKLVEFSNVKRVFGRTWALRGVNLAVEEGVSYGLIGRNGAGKTTLLRMIPALLHPTEGEVRVFGMDPWEKQEEVKLQLGYMSESDSFPARIKVRDLIDLCSSVYPKWDSKMAARLINDFDIDPQKRMGTFSTGKQRQVALICAICHRPPLLVLDEPAGSLDPVIRREFLEAVIELLLESGSTIVFSSHQFADVERLATSVGILHEGLMLAERPLDDYREKTCRLLVRGASANESELKAIPDCILLKNQDDGFLLTFIVDSGEALKRVQAIPGSTLDAQVQAISLEDLFIDWTRRDKQPDDTV